MCVFQDIAPQPQLIYALVESSTGKGFATEAAGAVLSLVRAQRQQSTVLASVDEANVASSRVLHKLGFHPTRSVAGELGRILLFELPMGDSCSKPSSHMEP